MSISFLLQTLKKLLLSLGVICSAFYILSLIGPSAFEKKVLIVE